MHTLRPRVVPLAHTSHFGWALHEACNGIESLPAWKAPSAGGQFADDGSFTVYALYLPHNRIKVGHTGCLEQRLEQHEANGLAWEDEYFADFPEAREACAVEGLMQRLLPAMADATIYRFDVHADAYARAAAPRLHARITSGEMDDQMPLDHRI